MYDPLLLLFGLHPTIGGQNKARIMTNQPVGLVDRNRASLALRPNSENKVVLNHQRSQPYSSSDGRKQASWPPKIPGKEIV